VTDLQSIFNAGRVRRWHTSPVLSCTDDYLDGHQGRVARLALALFPDDAVLLRAALTHDDGESATGDVPNPVKNKMPIAFRSWWDQMEDAAARAMWGPQLSPSAHRLRLCDKLDALMWVQHHAPHLLARADWQKDVAEVEGLSHACGVAHMVEPVLRGMRCPPPRKR